MSQITRVLILTALVAITPNSVTAQDGLPVAGGVITSVVGWRLDPFGSGKLVYHRGTDIAVPAGTPVRAVRGGRVVHAGIHGGHGATVIIEHGNGDRTLYGHNSALTVKIGQQADAGTVIALSGNSGRSTGPHVHYEVLPGGRSAVMVAQLDKSPAELPPAVNTRLRRGHEQKLDDAVSSILRTINSSSLLAGTGGQGG